MIMLPRPRQKSVYGVPLFPRSLSKRALSADPRPFRPFEHLVEPIRYRSGNQVRFYAQQPPNGGSFPGFSFQQQRNKGDVLKEFVRPSFLSTRWSAVMLTGRRVSTSLSWQGTENSIQQSGEMKVCLIVRLVFYLQVPIAIFSGHRDQKNDPK